MTVALSEYVRILKIAPKRMDVVNFAGIAALQIGEAAMAIKYLSRAAKAFPKDSEIAYNLGVALKQGGKLPRAATEFERATTLNPRHADAWNNLGSTLSDLNDIPKSAAAFARAIDIQPNNPMFLENAGGAEEGLGRPRAARQYFERALAAGGDRGRLLTCIAATWMDNQEGDNDKALEYLHAALAAAPDNIAAMALIGYVEERRHNLKAAEKAVAQGLAIADDDPLLNCVMARIENRRQEWDAAQKRLVQAANHCDDPALEVKIRYELGNVLDRVGRYDDAFAQIEQASRLQRELLRPDLNTFRDELAAHRQTSHLSPSAPSSEPLGAKLTFVVGFPRSGTTLVGAILNGNGRAFTLDERPLIDSVEAAIRTKNNGDLQTGLAALNDNDLPALRNIYFDTAKRYGWDGTSVLVDKHPLNMFKIGLLGRLFPDALTINVLRHPLDTCLSCFMQYFEPNPATVHFLKMETTVELYRDVMENWLNRRNCLGMKTINVNYETIVRQGVSGLKDVIDASALNWDDKMYAFDEQVKDSDIRTPSYRQVSEGIYSRAKGRWRHYAKHLGPARDALADLGERLGYDMKVG